MNAMMNEAQLCHCDIRDKTINFKSKSEHIISKTYIHKKECSTLVKEYEFINPDIVEVNYILNDTIEDYRKEYFQSIEYR